MSAMADTKLRGKRVLVLGAESDIGRAIASALAHAGAELALVASTTNPEAAFAVQRLARRLAAHDRHALAQAIDASNEAALRVMTRQVAKELGGLDALLVSADLGEKFAAACRFAAREMAPDRGRGGVAVVVGAGPENAAALADELAARGVRLHSLAAAGRSEEELAAAVLALLAAAVDTAADSR